ncbi:hypothetical protein BJV82DRAFT_324557 [Fennellomyces sp. T-0311]|nr:hypothetical protein BJV82DRAFT_324557 [Fennellomyces sp. T-0311]
MLKSREKLGSFSDDNNHTTANIRERLKSNDVLVISFSGKIYAVQKKDGTRIWRVEAPTGSNVSELVSSEIVSLFITDDDQLIVGSGGRTACLDLFTGVTKWLNKMPGCGYEEVGVIATSSRTLLPQVQQHVSQDNDSPPGYEEASNSTAYTAASVVISCVSGKCMAIDLATGQQLWLFKCPKGGYYLPVAIVEPVSAEPNRAQQRVFVACGTWLYCLQARTGVLEWSKCISNKTMFLGGNVTMATAWSSRPA